MAEVNSINFRWFLIWLCHLGLTSLFCDTVLKPKALRHNKTSKVVCVSNKDQISLGICPV